MDKICVTRHVEFEAAHLLYGYDGRCGSLHGHSYKLEVTVSCPGIQRNTNGFNFVMDFKKLDAILDDYIPDHCFITDDNNGPDTPEGQIAQIVSDNGMRIFRMDCPPSAENMVEVFAAEIQEQLEEPFVVEEVKLWETTNSFATWKRSDNF